MVNDFPSDRLSRNHLALSIMGMLAMVVLAGPTEFWLSEVVAQFVPTHYPPLSAADAKTLADAGANTPTHLSSWYGPILVVAAGLVVILIASVSAILPALPVAIPASFACVGITELLWLKFRPTLAIPALVGSGCGYIGISFYGVNPPEGGPIPLAGPLLWSSPVTGAIMGAVYFFVVRRAARRTSNRPEGV